MEVSVVMAALGQAPYLPVAGPQWSAPFLLGRGPLFIPSYTTPSSNSYFLKTGICPPPSLAHTLWLPTTCRVPVYSGSSTALSSLPSYAICRPHHHPPLILWTYCSLWGSLDTLHNLVFLKQALNPPSAWLSSKPILPCNCLLTLQTSDEFHPSFWTQSECQLPNRTQSLVWPAVFCSCLCWGHPQLAASSGQEDPASCSSPRDPSLGCVHTGHFMYLLNWACPSQSISVTSF